KERRLGARAPDPFANGSAGVVAQETEGASGHVSSLRRPRQKKFCGQKGLPGFLRAIGPSFARQSKKFYGWGRALISVFISGFRGVPPSRGISAGWDPTSAASFAPFAPRHSSIA